MLDLELNETLFPTDLNETSFPTDLNETVFPTDLNETLFPTDLNETSFPTPSSTDLDTQKPGGNEPATPQEPGGGGNPPGEPGGGNEPGPNPIFVPEPAPVTEPGGGDNTGTPTTPVTEPIPIVEPEPAPIAEPGTPNAPVIGPPGESNTDDGPFQPPGSRNRETAGVVSLPLYTLNFALSSTELVDETISATAAVQRSGTSSKERERKRMYPTLDDFSMLERVTSAHIYGHVTGTIANSDSNDILSDLSLMEVKTTVDATHLKSSSMEEEEVSSFELEIVLRTTLVFDGSTIPPTTTKLLSNTVRSSFVDTANLEDYTIKLQTGSTNLNNGSIDFFTSTSDISWAAVDNADDVVNQELSSSKPQMAWNVFYSLVLFILAITLTILLILRRRRKRKKRYWLKRRYDLDKYLSDEDNVTIVFEDGNDNEDREISVKGQHQMEQETSSSSLFSSLDRIFYGENAEKREQTDEDDVDYEEQYLPSSQVQRQSTTTTGGKDSSLLLMQRYDELVRCMELQQERIVSLEDKIANSKNQENPLPRDDAVLWSSSSQQQQQLETDLTKAKIKQLDLEHTLLLEEEEYSRIVASNQAGHQSDLIMESIKGHGGKG